jgi:hypothetical protein
MDIIAVDTETFYSKEYSLSKMTTEEYIRDPRFQVIGVAVKVGEGDTTWFSGTAKETIAFLRQYDWENSAMVAHNAMFDAAILSWRCGIQPKVILDTLSMSRAMYGVDAGHSLKVLAERLGLPAKGDEVTRAIGKRRLDFTRAELHDYGEYCRMDTHLTYEAFRAMMALGFPKPELKLVDLTLTMFTNPVLELDVPHLEGHLIRTQRAKAALIEDAGVDRKMLMSNPKFASMLEELDVIPPMKVSPTTGKMTFAFAKNDEDFQALMEHHDPQVQALCAARVGSKSTLEETRTTRFIAIGGRGRFPVPLRYYAAHTGRWGGCLVADTAVIVFDYAHGVCNKRIVDVLTSDLVWDGEEFVAHEGVVFSGYAETITWDGVEGTPDHVVFTDVGEISLRDAYEGGHNITTPRGPTGDDVASARHRARKHEM